MNMKLAQPETLNMGDIPSLKVLQKQILKQHVAEVTFMKADGSERVMFCTLKPNLLPDVVEEKEPKYKKKENDNVLPVWDLEKNAWRSFRVDSVKSMELCEEYDGYKRQ